MIEKLIDWSHQNFSKLPWRQNRTLYSTLVSEIMLQQTTVGTVLGHFDRFMQEYPSFEDVANATEERLTISWKGLGYYRRARNLKKACQFIADKGNVPEDWNELVKIPGIGEYTAGAILGIGMDKPYLAIDGNLERVIARLYNIEMESGPKLKKYIMEQFHKGEICQDIHIVGGRSFNEALMDLGRNFCKANKVVCDLCPLKSSCQTYQNSEPLSIPIKSTKKTSSHELTLLRVLVQDGEKFFVYQKKENEWLSGQWELPTYVLDSSDEKMKQYPKLSQKEEFDFLPSYKTLITKYKIQNKLLVVNLDDVKKLSLILPEGKWMPIEDTNQNLSMATLKAFDL